MIQRKTSDHLPENEIQKAYKRKSTGCGSIIPAKTSTSTSMAARFVNSSFNTFITFGNLLSSDFL